MHTAYLALGANLGDAHATLEAACAAIAALPETRWQRRSSWYRSRPVESTGPDYVNGVAEVQTALAPLALLDALQAIELQHGRERPYRNAPRTLDLDLLLYGDLHLDSERLVIPHPRLAERAFVLLPLLELRPSLTWPGVPDLPAHAAELAQHQGIEREDDL
jgi:2-amino-4-hydroxy-6-hydroxymethyldihydropteridine diphosphokinase